MFKSFVAASAVLAGSANAFWRMECPGRVGLARMDPLISPGEISQHAHSIHGSSGFSTTSSTAELLAGDCTSCRVTQDKSAYWHPAMYFQDAATGEFELVEQVGGMLAYYFLNSDNVTAFPQDFHMIAGSSIKRTFSGGDPAKPDDEKSSWGQLPQSILAERAIGFNCLNYDIDPEPTLYRHYLPEKSYLDANCKDGVRFELMFPSCWDGVNTDSESHTDHIAYPDLVINGNCPDDFPVQMPGLLFEVIWGTNMLEGRDGVFTFANGDPTGYGAHGDFIMGWEDDVLQQACDTCTNESGTIEDCPIFNIIDEYEAKECQLSGLPGMLMTEDMEGPFSLLPGDVKITWDEESAMNPVDAPEPPPPASDPPVTAPTLSYTPGDPLESLPGLVFKETSVSVAPAPTTTSTTPTPTPTPEVHIAAEPTTPTTTSTPLTTSTPTETISYWSTQFVTDGDIVSKILWEEEIVYVTEIDPVTTTVVVSAPEEKRHNHNHAREAHLHRHGHHH